MDIIEVLDGGMFTTVQDLGRYGYQRYGLPVAGAMDSFALRAANLLVGNGEGEAGLEMTLAGPHLRFLDETVVAITGADLTPTLDGNPFPMWRPVAVQKDAELLFHGINDGVRVLSCHSGRRGYSAHAWQPLHLYTGQHWRAGRPRPGPRRPDSCLHRHGSRGRKAFPTGEQSPATVTLTGLE